MKRRPNILGILFGIIVIVSLFLPFTTIKARGEWLGFSLADSYDRTLIIALIVIVAAGILLAVMGRGAYSVITGIFSLLLFTYVVTSMAKNRVHGDETINKLVNMIMKNGVGYYMLLVGGIGLIAAGVFDIVMKASKRGL